jgi:mannose-6-phosphate isomerase-like protein (cupin superfamily)
MRDQYNIEWNPHYNFEDGKNLAEIEKRARFATAFEAVFNGGEEKGSDAFKAAQDLILSYERKELGGRDGYDFGVIVNKDWGSNEVLSFHHENGVDTCIKSITVKPGNMLSLQSHQGRKEEWKVTEGTLTLISDGRLYEVSDNGVFDITEARSEITDASMAQKDDGHWSIILPKGSIHCMINTSNAPVTVIETQTGITRESDNNRFIDQIRNQKEARAIIPLTSELHYKSALLYWRVEAQIAQKMQEIDPNWGVSYAPKKD